jgi:predicted alpha/beta superfamily hydrolase
LIVYVPPDYDKETSRRYPVLYMQDGQNLMDEATSYQGIEWGIDEAAQKLIAAGAIEPTIIVGVYNTGEFRAAEFTPPLESVDKSKAKGDAYAKMMVEEIKPFIDSKYRTLKERDKTSIGGGSMGALIAMYTAKTHPDVYGQVVALSPWLRLNDKAIGKELIGDGAWLKNTRFYIDMGTDPGHNYAGSGETALQDVASFVEMLQQGGASPQYVEIEGGKHNEASWAATIEQVLTAVLGKSSPTSQPAGTQPAVSSGQ